VSQVLMGRGPWSGCSAVELRYHKGQQGASFFSHQLGGTKNTRHADNPVQHPKQSVICYMAMHDVNRV
jgi:hypothetical protein